MLLKYNFWVLCPPLSRTEPDINCLECDLAVGESSQGVHQKGFTVLWASSGSSECQENLDKPVGWTSQTTQERWTCRKWAVCTFWVTAGRSSLCWNLIYVFYLGSNLFSFLKLLSCGRAWKRGMMSSLLPFFGATCWAFASLSPYPGTEPVLLSAALKTFMRHL